MAHGLRGVHQHQRTLLMGHLNDVLNGVYTAGHIGNPSNCHQFGSPGEHLRKCLQIQPAVGKNRRNAKGCPGSPACLLPGEKVGVMLHLGGQNLILRGQAGKTQTSRHQIDGGRTAAGEDNLVCAGSAQEPPNVLPGILHSAGRGFAEIVNATVYVGLIAVILQLHFPQNRLRQLCCGTVIQIAKGIGSDSLFQNRNVPAAFLPCHCASS